MNDSEGAALFAAIQENPADLAPRLIYSDWLEENGRENEAFAWRGKLAKSLPAWDYYIDHNGRSSGAGYGYEAGRGDGGANAGVDGDQGSYGNGAQDGFGHGERNWTNAGSSDVSNGYGDGTDVHWSSGRYGYSHSGGFGGGVERGNGGVYGFFLRLTKWHKKHKRIIEGKPVIGKQTLIWCGRGFAWIGHVDEMYAPGCYKLSNAGMLCQTGPHSWMAVASGAARHNYIYRHAPDGIVYTGPDVHGAVEWKGELPGRDMR